MSEQLDVLARAALLNRRGTYLFISKSNHARTAAELLLIKAGVCTSQPPVLRDDCLCPDCQSALTHQKVLRITPDTFDEQMLIAYSYPPKVVSIQEVDDLTHGQQMQLLIWLELYSSNHVIILTARESLRLLPTIHSRSFVIIDVPKFTVDSETRERASTLLVKLFRGELRIEEVIQPDEGVPLSHAMQLVMVEEMERRQLKTASKTFNCGNAELQTLLKLVGRYLDAPKNHNLPLLLRSFQMLALQNVR